jgi:uncharacterized protein
MRKGLITVLVLSVSLALVISGCSAQDDSKAARTITITETGTAKVKPDVAYLSASIVTENKNSNAAVTENRNKTNSTIDSLTKLGVKKDDIATSNYSVNIIRDYNASVTSGLPYPIVGYSVQNTLNVTIRNIESIGSIIDGVAKVNGIDISQLSFGITDKSTPKSNAVKAAVLEARKQADNAAKALDAKIAGIKTVRVESSGQGNLPFYYGGGIGGGGGQGTPTPISSGDAEVSATVYVDFTLAE